MKNIFTTSIILILMGCTPSNKKLTVKSITQNPIEYENKMVSLEGHLYVSEMMYKSLYLKKGSKHHLDLSLTTKQLPDGLDYSPESYLCVMLEGIFNQYSRDFLALNSRSTVGRIDVKNIELCDK